MLTRQSSAAQSLGDRDAMRGFSHSARQRLTADAPPRLRLRVLGQLIIAHRALANVSEAATVAAEALKVYRGLEDGEGSYILQQAAATAFDGGDLAATRELLDEACQRFRRRDSLNLGFALTALMEICSEMGDFDTAERLAAEVREWIDAPGPNLSLAQLHQDLAIYHHARGETDTALGHARQAVELLPKLGMRDVDGAAIRTLAEVGRGVDPDAARHATEAVRLSGESDALTDHIEALRVLAQVTSATAPAERARDLARRHGYRFLEAKALAVLTEVHRADGDRAAARRDGAEALRLLDWCGAKPLRDHVARLIE
jgi:tetratricopeptide (TPR) repeat protein